MKQNKTKINKINKNVIKNNRIRTTFMIIIVVIVIAALIIFAKLTFINSNKVVYNSFPFYKEGDLWNAHLVIKNRDLLVPFSYLPKEVEEIYIDPSIKTMIRSLDVTDNIVLAVDEDAPSLAVIGTANIARLHNLNNETKYIITPIHGGIYDDNFNLTEYLASENKSTDDIFRTNCELSNKDFIVIRFTAGNETSMKFSEETNNCIIATAAEPEDFRRLSDRFVFGLLGVIN
jgi:hypothetical protein